MPLPISLSATIACACGRRFDRNAWEALRLLGYQSGAFGDSPLELRVCVCGSCLSLKTPIICACGQRFDRNAWEALRLLGYQKRAPGDTPLELRLCVCGSCLSCDIADLADWLQDAAAQGDSLEALSTAVRRRPPT